MAFSVLNDRRHLACSCASQCLSGSTYQSLQSCPDPAQYSQDHACIHHSTNELAAAACCHAQHACNKVESSEIKTKLYSKIQNLQHPEEDEYTPSFKGYIRCESIVETNSL